MSLTSLPTPTTILAPHEAEHNAVDLTHNTKGSRWDKTGDNELIDSGRFRYNYNPVTGVFEGRVIMGSWTNEMLDPRDMTTANWGRNHAAVGVAQDAVGIDGDSNTACTITDDDGTSAERIGQQITIADNSKTHTVGIFIEKDSDTSRFPLLVIAVVGGTTQVSNQIYFNTSTGATQLRNGTDTFTVEDEGDFWFVWGTVTNNGSGNTGLNLDFYPAWTDTMGSDNNTTGSVVVDVASAFKDTSFAPPTPVYGETAGQSFTQDPDQADVSTLSDIDLNADENMFNVTFVTGKDSGVLFDLHTDGNNRIYAERNSSNEIHFIIDDGGTTQADLNLGTVADDTEGKIVVGWKKNDIAGCLDGGTVKTDTSATIPSVTDLHIGRDYNDANYLNGGLIRHLTHPRKEDSTTIQDLSK